MAIAPPPLAAAGPPTEPAHAGRGGDGHSAGDAGWWSVGISGEVKSLPAGFVRSFVRSPCRLTRGWLYLPSIRAVLVLASGIQPEWSIIFRDNLVGLKRRGSDGCIIGRLTRGWLYLPSISLEPSARGGESYDNCSVRTCASERKQHFFGCPTLSLTGPKFRGKVEFSFPRFGALLM